MIRRFLPLVMPMILVSSLSCSDQSQPEVVPASGQSADAEISASCELIVDRLATFGIDAATEEDEGACSIDIGVPLASLDTDVDPLESLREFMVAEGWVEDIESMADGPGTSSFRLVSSGHFCRISGGAPAWIDDDDGIRQSDEYFVSAVCRRAH